MGKSSTANSLFGDRVANVAAFQQDAARPVVISRQAAAFTLTVIDTPGLNESDSVNELVRTPLNQKPSQNPKYTMHVL